MNIRLLWRGAVALLCLLLPLVVRADNATGGAFPRVAVRIVVPNTPGSAADVAARFVATRLAEAWQQPVMVENKAGAGGIVAADAVAKAVPDGHTLLLGADGPITILPSLQAPLPYDPKRDLVPVVSLGETDFVLVAHPRTGWQRVQDFIEAARRQPGRINYASAGNGSPQQFAMEALKQAAGIQVTHIPYRGGPLGLSDVVAGQVDLMFIAIGPALPHIRSGRLVALATGGVERHPLLPEVPTVAESYKGFRAGTWFGLFAPAGTPPAVVAAIATQTQQLLAQPGAQAELAAQGIRATGYTATKFQGLVLQEADRFATLARSVGLKSE
jgi:tripartite-type tricarboxylate transporter receptor subunit TctC